MGQGTYTSMPCLSPKSWRSTWQVTLEAAPPDDKLYANPLLGFQVTGGSTSVPGYVGAAAPRRRRRAHHADSGGGG